MKHRDINPSAPPQRRSGCVTLVRNADGWVLLVKQNYGEKKWILPGGGAHENEPLADAARRELKEEIGLELPLTHVIAVDQVPYTEHKNVAEGVNYVFNGGVLSSDQAAAVAIPPTAAEELAEFTWVPPERLGELVQPYQENRIRQALTVADAGGGLPMLTRGEPVSA